MVWIEGLPIKVPAMYDSGDRSRSGGMRWNTYGRHQVVGLTSRGGDAATQGYKRSDIFTKQVAHLLDEFHTDARVATDQRIHADQDGTPDP